MYIDAYQYHFQTGGLYQHLSHHVKLQKSTISAQSVSQVPVLQGLGLKHVGYGVQPAHYVAW